MKRIIIVLLGIVCTFSVIFPFQTRLSSSLVSQPVSPPPPAKPTLVFKRFPSDLKQLWNLVTPRFTKMPAAVRPNDGGGTVDPAPPVNPRVLTPTQIAFTTSSTVSGKPFLTSQSSSSPNPFISQPTTSKPFIAQSSSTSLDTNTNTANRRRLTNSQIRDCIWNWMMDPQGPTTGPQSILISEKVLSQNQTHICKYRVFQSQNPSSTILNVDQQTNVIYAGGLLQGKDIIHGNQIYKSIPFGLNHRNPLWIQTIGNSLGSVKADAPISSEVHKVVNDFIMANTNTQNAQVYISFSKSDYMLDVFNALNFNSKIADKLGLTAIPGQQANRKDKIFISMLQVIGKFAPSKINPTGGPADAVGTFLNDATVDIQTCRDFEKYDWWGLFNRPAYVNQEHFGRMVFISIDATPDALDLYDKASSYPPNMNQILNQIFISPSLRMFSIGSSGSLNLNALKSGSWQSYFYPLSTSSLSSLRPIRFAVLDFRDNPITVTNKFQYDTSSCMKKTPHKIQIRIVDAYKKAGVQFKLTGQGSFYGVGISQVSGTSPLIDITNHLTQGTDDQMRIYSVVGHHNFVQQYYRDVTLEIYIDGAYRQGFYSGCKACNSRNDAIVCTINKMAGSYSCAAN